MPSLIEINGVGPFLAAAFAKNNYRTIAKIASANPSELSQVPGISKKRAVQIIKSANSILPQPRNSVKTKQRSVDPAQTGPKTAVPKPPKQSSIKEKIMSKKDAKEKVKKLKKKIKKLKAKKKELLAKESKKTKKKKSAKKK